ncbi:hypothetical protein [Arenimonas oryziterrae]|nr:hypothetical protein [Arenimonas oryziterrae]
MAHVHAPGLVLHMYPEELLKHGAGHTVEPEDAVSAQHYFVCLSSDAKEGLWVPLFQAPGKDLKMISESAKSGHARWTRGPSYYDLEQLWRIPHKAAQRGAAAAMDQSLTKSPNTVALTALPQREEFPSATAFRPAAR